MGRALKRIQLLLVVCLLFMNVNIGTVAAKNEGTIVVDGQTLITEVPPTIIDGRMMVPMRPIFEALGAEVTWDGALQAVYASKDDQQVYLEINNPRGWIGFQAVELEVAPYVLNGRTMVPLRFVSESLGAKVNWEPATRTAYIYTAASDQNDAKEEDQNVYGFARDKKQIREKWAAYRPVYDGTPYVQEPHTRSAYKIGKLNNGFIADGVNMANFVRYLAGLPDDLVATEELNERAQYGAVLLQAFGTLTHFPEQPADMSDDFYALGALSARSSNISQYRYSTTGSSMAALSGLSPDDSMTLASSVVHYMRDEDDSNVRTVGHRRWILNPQLKQIGFGYSHRYTEEGIWKHYERFSVMEVMDTDSRAEKVDYDYIAWPTAGYFPTEFFGTSEAYGSDPWSVSLNPEKYAAPVMSEVEVTLTHVNSGKSWTIDQQHAKLEAKETFFNVDLNGYGVKYAIIFRPDETARYEDGDHYKVTIKGLKDKNGRPTELKYETVFFDL